jgi:hypothetical protein
LYPKIRLNCAGTSQILLLSRLSFEKSKALT